MSGHFKRGEPLARGVERLVHGQLEAALQLVSGGEEPLDHRVHEARKCLKRLRALLALAGQNLEPHLLAESRAAIRGAAHALAELRNTAALNETFLGLHGRAPDALEPEVVGAVRQALAADVASGETSDALERARAALCRASDATRELRVPGAGWDAIDSGFRRTYRRARKLFRRARDTRQAEAFHDFRTEQKRHYYQLELFVKVWPKLVRVETKELDRLGEELGEHHDLSLLLPELARHSLPEGTLGSLPRLIEQRKKELERKIVFRAARVFAERARARSRRFAAYHAAARRRGRKHA